MSKENERKRIYGLDYLRALMSLAVVAWHTKIFGTSNAYSIENFSSHRVVVSDVLNFHFLMLAVPTFFLLSLFLFSSKGKKFGYFVIRLEYFTYLYFFWLVIELMFRGNLFAILSQYLSNATWRSVLEFFVRGGHSRFYFLFSLAFLVCCSFITLRLPKISWWIFLVLSLVLLWLFPLIVITHDSFFSLEAYWNPLVFLPYVFSGAILADCFSRGFFRERSKEWYLVVLGLCAGFVAASITEWYWLPHEGSFVFHAGCMPGYTRISVAMGSILLVLLALPIKRPPPGWVKVMSDYSLGLYCLHGFVANAYAGYIGTPESFLGNIARFIVVVDISYILCFIGRRAFSKGMI